MAEQKSGFGKVVLWVVLGIVAIIVAGTVLGWLIKALFQILIATLIIGAIGGVALLLVRAGRRTLSGGRNRRELPY